MSGSEMGGWLRRLPRRGRLPRLASPAQPTPQPSLPRGSPSRWPSGGDGDGDEGWRARLLQPLPEPPPPRGLAPSPRVLRNSMRGGTESSRGWRPSGWTRVWVLRQTGWFPRTQLSASPFEPAGEACAAPPTRVRPLPRPQLRADSPRAPAFSPLAVESHRSVVSGAVAVSGLRRSPCFPFLSTLRARRACFCLDRLDAVAGFGSARACPQRRRPPRGPVLLRSYRNPFSWERIAPGRRGLTLLAVAVAPTTLGSRSPSPRYSAS